MSGEQLWDSLVSLNYPDLDTRINERARKMDSVVTDYSEMKAEDIFEEVMAKYKARKPAMGMAAASPRSMKCARSKPTAKPTPA